MKNLKTNKQTIELRRSIVLFFMSIIFCVIQSCSTEEALMQNEPTIKTVSREHTIQFLQQNQLRIGNNKATKTSSLPSYGAILQEEISNSDQYLTIVPIIKSDKREQVRIVLLTVNDTLKSAVFTMYPDDEKKTKDFSGRIMITNLSGEFKNGFRVRDGIIVAQFVKKITEKQVTRTANIITNEDEPVQLREVVIPPRKKGTIQINYIFDWSSAYDNSSPDALIWDFEKSGGGGGGAAAAEAEAEPLVEEEEDFEDKIDDSELYPCPKGVMDKLKNSTNNDIAAILKKLGANKDFTVNVVSGFAGGLPAQSTSNKAFVYNIIISVDYVSSTDLFRASNILHEIVHVYFMSIVDEYKSNPKNSQYTYNLTNFPSLFQAYCDKKFPPTNTTSANAHHLEMANQYVETIASALQEFNKINDPNGNIPYQVYSDLAWGGLMNTPVYDEKYVTGGTEDTRIRNRYSCESNGNEVASGTPNAQKPAGKPCK